jgi:pimeloyl-ACP methyl ester carboxylesterase
MGSLHSSSALGHDDLLTPLSFDRTFPEGIAGARLVVFDQCGHVPQSEKPRKFNKAVIDFLAQP